MMKVWILVGTRPEVIKQSPVYLEFARVLGRNQVAMISTGQHKELLAQALTHFGIETQVDLGIMKPDQTLCGSAADVLRGMENLFRSEKPDWLIVQGDTTSAAMAAWAAFLCGVKVVHNEAGLRSYDLKHPVPEEANRKLISVVADKHFAPTELAREAMLREGIPSEKIILTGNTGIDALKMTLERPAPKRVVEMLAEFKAAGRQPVLLTAHRRENAGDGMSSWFDALAKFLADRPDLALVYPIHPNNLSRGAIEKHLSNNPQVTLCAPLDYLETCHLLQNSRFVVTDSGGIQEEATTLGVPVVVCRKTTERMEAVHAGVARLAGLETQSVLDAMSWAYSAEKFPPSQIFGDGLSSRRIVQALVK